MKSWEIVKRTDALFKDLKKYPENSKEYRNTESEIVKINRPLVTYVAKRFFPFVGPALTSDDLISEGYVALVKAVRTFKFKKQIAFSSYAVQCIKNEVIRLLQVESKNKKLFSLETEVKTKAAYGEKLKLGSILRSPVNLEEDIVEKDEIQRQIAWIRKNLDHLSPTQKQVLISKYLSGEASLIGNALAKKFNCTKQNISLIENSAIDHLKKMYLVENSVINRLKMYFKAHPEELERTREDNSPKQNVSISKSVKKLSTLREGIHDNEHLKGISENVENVM